MNEDIRGKGGMYQGGYLQATCDDSHIVQMSDLTLDYETLQYRFKWFGTAELQKKRFMIMQLAQIGENTYAEIVEVKKKG